MGKPGFVRVGTSIFIWEVGTPLQAVCVYFSVHVLFILVHARGVIHVRVADLNWLMLVNISTVNSLNESHIK